MLRYLRSQEFDVALALRRYITQSTLMMMQRVRARRRLCAWLFPTNCDAALATRLGAGWEHLPGAATVRSELEYYRDFLRRGLGLDVAGGPRLRDVGPGTTPPEPRRVGLCISGASTNWPADFWCQLARLLQQQGLALVLFGGPDAQALAEQLQSAAPGVESLVGQRSLREAVPDLQRLALLVGNDTGFTHFASLVVGRVLVILGGGTFGRFFPWPGPRAQSTIFRAMECFDCDWQCQFERRECLWAVTPAAVAEAARRILEAADPVPRAQNLHDTVVEFVPGWRRLAEGTGRDRGRLRLEPGLRSAGAES